MQNFLIGNIKRIQIQKDNMAISHSDIQALNFFNLFEKFGENVGGKEQDKKCWRWIEKMPLVLHRKG